MLSAAGLHLSASRIGAVRYPRATALWAAHYLEIEDQSKQGLIGAGPVTSQSGTKTTTEGSESGSITFSPPDAQGPWPGTKYGIQLSRYLGMTTGPAAMVMPIR